MAACDGTGKIPGTNCRMDGFDRLGGPAATRGTRVVRRALRIRRTRTSRTARRRPILSMAKQYVLADQMFASNFDVSSFVSHQYIIAGQASHTVNYPESFWGCPGGSTDKAYTIDYQRGFSSSPVRVVCFDKKHSVTSSTMRSYLGRFTRIPLAARRTPAMGTPAANVPGDEWHLECLPGDSPHLLRERLEERRHHGRLSVSHRRATASCSGNVDYADLRKLRSRNL